MLLDYYLWFFSNIVGEKDPRIPGAKGSRGSFTTIRID
jgi:hypothetical protein